MKKGILINAVLMMLLIAAGVVNAQLKNQDNNLGLGIKGGVLRGDTDFGRSEDYDVFLRGYLRYPLVGPLHGEFGAGYGVIKEENLYKTRLYPVDVRVLLSPFSSEVFNLYAYGGIGALYFKSDEVPPNSTEGSDNSGWTGYIPGGLGVQLKLSEHTALEVSGGYNHSLTDKLDAYSLDKNDGFWNAAAGLTFTFSDGKADPDEDGLINEDEAQFDTDKNDPDTDGDGLEDGAEVHQYHTSPTLEDTDFDGLSDRAEVMEYHSDPTKKDSDGDGLADQAEVETYKTDPAKADTDGDGLNDREEIKEYNTNPLKADSDGDGLTDQAEIAEFKTDPLKADTDGDGLRDGVEVREYKTSPLMADTDQGSVNDSTEIGRGTDPLNAADDVEQKKENKFLAAGVGVPIVLEGVFFKLNSSQITPESEVILDKVYQTLEEYPDVKIEIRGHTDATGSRAYNMKLSRERAESVKAYLVNKGISSRRITTKGYGPDVPIATNATPEGRQKNRRIEFVRVK